MEETEAMMMMMMSSSNWGTWEELVLGGAVLRHGTRDWDAVAAELRSRTFYPYYFTPEVCKAKYQDLQVRYSGCTAWFEELRKQRVAELKRELEKSQGSIGSLESKLESLKSQKVDEDHNGNYASGHTESPPSVGNLARPDFPPKETTTTTSKDGFSAGSFTEQTQTDSSPECQIPAVVPTEIKTEEGENATSKETILKKRRGKRKRKDCGKETIEGSLRDMNQVRSVDKEESTGDCDRDRAVRSCNDQNDGRGVEEENIDLMSVLNSIVESENLSVFQKRTDSQRRGRYKKTIRQHMDLNFMRSRISDRTIVSAKELYRDILLLCNNAIVFYSKESRENKAAHSLRDFVTKNFWQNIRDFTTETGASSRLPPPADKPNLDAPPEKPSSNCTPPEKPISNLLLDKPKCNAPVKPRSARPNHPKWAGKAVAEAILVPESKKACDAEVPTESKEVVVVEKKRVVDKPVKVGRSGGSKRVENPVNGGRKRGRKK